MVCNKKSFGRIRYFMLLV